MQANGDKTPIKNGKAGIQRGQVVVVNPEEGGQPALITPGEHVQVLVNGLVIAGPQLVTAEDDIKIIPNITEPDWQLETRVSPDRMEAFIKLHRTPGARYEIEEQLPDEVLTVNAKLAEIIKPRPKVEEIMQMLLARGITFGIVPEMLQLAIDSEQDCDYLAAKGIAPTPGIDAGIRCVFEEKGKKTSDEEEGPLVHLHDVVSVEPGELLAEVIPPEPGKSGTDVYGMTLLPPPPKNITLAAGKGAEVNKEGTRAVAIIAGKPVLKGQTISVSAVYTLTGDVDAKTGQIIFKGDVTVQGNVLDGMKVEASGKVIINGYVANSTIIAGGDVLIAQNLVGGTIRAGGISAVCQRLKTNLISLDQILKLLAPAVGQLKTHPSVARNKDLEKLGDGVLLKMLLDTKFKQVPAALHEIGEDLELLIGAIESKELDFFRKSFTEFSKKICARVPIELKTVALIEEFIKKFSGDIKSVSLLLQERAKERAKLSVPYVQNSHLESSGDVIISGKGCYSSNIYAGENVVIYGSPGVFRGGEIIAGGNVKVRELGSQAEAATTVQVGKEKTVSADRAYPGVTIKAGARIEKITGVTNGLSIEGI